MALFHGTAQDILCQGFQIFESTEMLCGYRFRLGYGYTDLDTDTDFVSNLRGSLDPGLGLRSVRTNLSGERDISRLAIDGSWLSHLRVSATMSRCKSVQPRPVRASQYNHVPFARVSTTMSRCESLCSHALNLPIYARI